MNIYSASLPPAQCLSNGGDYVTEAGEEMQQLAVRALTRAE